MEALSATHIQLVTFIHKSRNEFNAMKLSSLRMVLVLVAGLFFSLLKSQYAFAETFACGASGSYTVTGTTVTADNGCSGELNIQSGVTVIANSVFKNNVNITSVTIPDSVLTIEDEAFKETLITSLDLEMVLQASEFTRLGE